MNDLTKYFFNRCFELLNKKSFDTYRASLHNPYTIFKELSKGIDGFNKKKIRHFDHTVAPIAEEAKILLDRTYTDDILIFKSFTYDQIIKLLDEKCIKGKGDDTRSVMLMCKAIAHDNLGFTRRLFERIAELLVENDPDKTHLVDKYAGWLISQQVYRGFARRYTSFRFRRAHKIISNGGDIVDTLQGLSELFLQEKQSYKVIFKLKSDSIANLKFASQSIVKLDTLHDFLTGSKHINPKFKELEENEMYAEIEVNSFEFWTALKLSYQIISETIEINILHQTENKIIIENQAIVYHVGSNAFRFEPVEDSLDGYYDYNEDEFSRFIENYKNIKSSVAKEKLRSAMRFYKIGNDSLEIEHKILNYWVGFEQLFSSVDTGEDSTRRIKSFYTALSCCYYIQRRVNYLVTLAERKKYTNNGAKIEYADLKATLLPNLKYTDHDPLLEKRIRKYINDFNTNHSIRENIKVHKKRLELHLTRIYKIRNELVHEGKTSFNLYLIASHLRHYLLFSIEQITNEINENPWLEHLDDVFIYYENLYNQIIKANDIDEIFAIKEFKGYME